MAPPATNTPRPKRFLRVEAIVPPFVLPDGWPEPSPESMRQGRWNANGCGGRMPKGAGPEGPAPAAGNDSGSEGRPEPRVHPAGTEEPHRAGDGGARRTAGRPAPTNG